MGVLLAVGSLFIPLSIMLVMIAFTVASENRLLNEGVTADAICIKSEYKKSDGISRWFNTVEYLDSNGEVRHAKLDYTGANLSGSKLQIKYLHGKYGKVVLI